MIGSFSPLVFVNGGADSVLPRFLSIEQTEDNKEDKEDTEDRVDTEEEMEDVR